MLTILHVFTFCALDLLWPAVRSLSAILAVPYYYIYPSIRVLITHRVLLFPSPNPPSYHEHEPSESHKDNRSID